MTREQASKLCHETLIKHGLKDWSVRINTNATYFCGLCLHKDKSIVLSGHHIDQHPDSEVTDTILHEVAHALVGSSHGHDTVWQYKAKSLGCRPEPCSEYSISPQLIDEIRSGATVEIEFEEVTFARPKYKITRLQDKCEHCGKVAVEKSNTFIPSGKEDVPDEKYIVLTCGHILIKKIPKGTPFHKLMFGAKPDCEHVWNKNTCVECGGFKPFPFQIEGMNFTEQALAVNKGCAILDEMGLGKTIQSLGISKFHPEYYPVLYVVKSGLRFQWLKQIMGWCGDDFMGQIIQSGGDFVIPNLKTYVISYDMMVPKVRKSKKTDKVSVGGFDINKLKKLGIKLIILDECQQIKNPDSTRTQQVRKIVNDRFWREDELAYAIIGRERHEVKVIALSGTPWKNRGSEFFSVLNMIAPMKFPSYQKYLDTWVQVYWDGAKRKEGGIKNPEKFKEYIKDIAIRRERIEVMPELPKVNRTKLFVQMTEDEDKLYSEEVDRFVAWYQEQVIGGEETNSMHILAKMSKMRHLAGLAKIPATIEHVEEFLEDTERKLTIFVHHQDVGAMLYDQCKEKVEELGLTGQVPVYKLTGSMSGEERFQVETNFNKNPRCILVASTLAAGEGLNLQTGADCIMHERQWNPANEEQAEGRFIRIGQMFDFVNAIYAEAVGSIDAMFDAIVEAKRRYFYKSMNNNEAPPWNQDEIIKELADIIVRQHNKRKVA